ncbi:polysaccharide biosynthesis tyrosine autokinase [Methyloligella sp. 2.7D]
MQVVGAATDRLDIREVYDFFLRRWRFIAGTTGIVLLLALVVISSIPARYTAAAQILLDPPERSALGGQSALSDIALDTAMVDSQVALIKSHSLLRRVVEKETLIDDPEFGSSAGKPGFFASLFSSADEKADPSRDRMAQVASTGKLANAVDVARQGRTYILKIAVTSKSPKRAADLANAVADAYIVDQLEASYEAAKRSSAWLNERLQTIREQLRKSERAVETFRTEHHLVATNTGTINEQQLSEINAKLVSARAEAAESRAKWEQANRLLEGGGKLDSVPDVVKSPVIASLRQQEAEVSAREADLVTKYGDRHPLVVNVRAEQAAIRNQIDAEVHRIIDNLKNNYEVARSREQSLQQSLRELTGETGLDNASSIRLRELEREAAANKTLYEQFLSRAKVTEEEKSYQAQGSRIISAATPPGGPSYPNKRLFLAVAMLLGVGLGAGGAFLLELFNPGFTSPRQLEEQLHLPVLSSIAFLDDTDLEWQGRNLTPQQLCLAKPFSRFSESIRYLRTGIEMADIDNPPKLVMVTSAMPGEGKTTIATALAFSAAAGGSRVLLVDCDLRRPSLTKSFSLEKTPGLVDYLMQQVELQRVVHKYRDAGGVCVIGSGATKTSNPPDLLNSVRMKETIASFAEFYDLVIFDTPPVGPVIDSVIVSRMVDKVVLVTRWGSTPRDMVGEALKKLAKEKKIAGLALNMIDESQAARYGRHAYYGTSYYQKYYTQ